MSSYLYPPEENITLIFNRLQPGSKYIGKVEYKRSTSVTCIPNSARIDGCIIIEQVYFA